MNVEATIPNLERKPAKDCDSFKCEASNLVQAVRSLKDQGYQMLVDLTAIDHGVEASPRFSTIYHLLNLQSTEYLRITVDCESDEDPVVPSIVEVFAAANWHEREVYDMFGIRFENHPDLRRILMWDEYEYFPLRKEFPLAGIESEYPEADADVVEHTQAKIKAVPMAGGPFVSPQEGPMSSREPKAKDQSWTEKRPKRPE